MMTPITLEQAIQIAPSIGATRADINPADTYQFISTRSVLEHVLDNGWSIVGASAAGRSLAAQHRVTLVRENDLNNVDVNAEGVLRMELFNSHNKSKRFMSAIGFFKWACSNGLIAAYGPAESIRTKHRFSDQRMETIMDRIREASEYFPQILNVIDSFKQRRLSQEEQTSFAKYAIHGRYLYRKSLPGSFSNIDRMAEKMLTVRRDADDGDTAWQVYNRVQENIVRGINGITRPLRGYDDSIRVNRLLWKGTEASLASASDRFKRELDNLLVKNKNKTLLQKNNS
jgi:hypothetical protein